MKKNHNGHPESNGRTLNGTGVTSLLLRQQQQPPKQLLQHSPQLRRPQTKKANYIFPLLFFALFVVTWTSFYISMQVVQDGQQQNNQAKLPNMLQQQRSRRKREKKHEMTNPADGGKMTFQDHFRPLGSSNNNPNGLQTSSQQQEQQLPSMQNNNNNKPKTGGSVRTSDVPEPLKNINLPPESIRDKESPIPNPPHPIPANSFSACLLVMDDNPRLVEWLAYHYHVLPLRYLIIAVDPRSKHSPTYILNRWRRMGMVIEEWSDVDFMKSNLVANPVSDADGLQVKRDRHRMRQKTFFRQCLLKLHDQNRTYTTLIDTDEFLMYNHAGGDQYDDWERQQLVKHKNSQFQHKERIPPKTIPPPKPSQAGAMIDYIQQEAKAGHPFYQSPCISCPRLQFGAMESTGEEQSKLVPKVNNNGETSFVVNPERLDTLRFRKHAHRNDFVKNGLSKSIIDVSRVPNIYSIPRIDSLHRPIKTICPAPWRDEWVSGLRIHHYLGSWEAYSYRDDARRGGERSKEGWAFKARDADDTDDNIRPWLEGFVETHGVEKTQELLQDAGLPKTYTNENEKAWTIMFLDEILQANETKGNDVRVAFDNFVRDMHNTTNNNDPTS